MLLSLPMELRKIILSFLTRKEYKETVPCKSLLLCKSYLDVKEFSKLKTLPLVKLTQQELEKLFSYSYLNNLWLIDKLITNFKVDPSNDDNCAIRCVSCHGRLAIVNRLLQDSRVDPSADDNYAIRKASENGHVEVVERLLLDPRDCAKAQSTSGLSQTRVDPSDCDNYAICTASTNGHAKVVERLLEDSTERRLSLIIAGGRDVMIVFKDSEKSNNFNNFRLLEFTWDSCINKVWSLKVYTK